MTTTPDAPEQTASPTEACERELGRYVYRIIEALIDAEPGTPEGAELAYLSRLAADVEEYGTDGLTEDDLRRDPSRWQDPLKQVPAALRRKAP